MKLVATTLTGNSEGVIGDALRSVVSWVDTCLVIDTGVTDRTLEVAREVAGEKLVVRKFAWIHDFAAARNFALDAALEAGGTWAMSLDTDERIQPNGDDVRAILEASSVECFMVMHYSETHVRERIFRLPAKARFVGPTHEAYPGYGSHDVLPKTRCVELEKTPEQLKKKFERDAGILEKHTRENPTDPRWHYYLGDTLQSLGRHAEAVRAYMECADLRGWNEESAWACYRAAECHCALGKWHRAVDACAMGLARHAGIAELAWLAGFASFRAGYAHQAVWWSRMAIAMGCFEGCGADVKRIGFRHPPALWEGPYDVLRYALEDMGDKAGAEEAGRKCAEAKARREGTGKRKDE
jgi:hypothetical protein